MRDTLTTIDAEQFRNASFIQISVLDPGGWTRKVKDASKLLEYWQQVETEVAAKLAAGEPVDKSRLAVQGGAGAAARATIRGSKSAVNSSKTLLFSPQLDALRSHLSATKMAIVGKPEYGGFANPSGFLDGVYVIANSLIPRAKAIIAEGLSRLSNEFEDDEGKKRPGYLTAFLDDYPAAIERARTLPVLEGGLGPLFNRADYPDPEKVARSFGIVRRVFAFSIPEGLDGKDREEAAAEMREELRNCTDMIKAGLREGLSDLLRHAEETLTTQPGEKPKVIKASLLENVLTFCDTFALRNTMNDTAMAAVVAQVKERLTGVDLDKARTFPSVREETRARFAALADKVDEMIEQSPVRRFGE